MAICVFCGKQAPSSKMTSEHVYPQWLRQFPAYDALLASDQQRSAPMAWTVAPDEEGRFQGEFVPRGGKLAPLLPDVQVKICGPCNNNWMSRLETYVKENILVRLINREPLELSGDQQRILTVWVIKTALMYAQYLPAADRRYLVDEYRELCWSGEAGDDSFDSCQIPAGSMVWTGVSDSTEAQIAAAIDSIHIGSLDTKPGDIAEKKPNFSSFYLATHGVFFVFHHLHSVPSDAGLMEALLPVLPENRSNIQQLWPPSPSSQWPPANTPHSALALVRGHIAEARRAISIGILGKTVDDVEQETQRGYGPSSE